MSISLGIYDLFSYILPGSVYLFILIRALGFLDEIQRIEFGLAQLFAFFGLAYRVGLLLDPLATKLWYYKFFTSKDLKAKVLDQLKINNPNIEIDFTEKQQGVLLSKIHSNTKEVSAIDRYSTLKIMFRNVSFGLLLLSIVQLILFFLHQFGIIDLVISAISIIFSILAGIEARKFDQWATLRIFETFISLAIEPASLVKVKMSKRKIDASSVKEKAG
jgi:hypothetical protein